MAFSSGHRVEKDYSTRPLVPDRDKDVGVAAANGWLAGADFLETVPERCFMRRLNLKSPIPKWGII